MVLPIRMAPSYSRSLEKPRALASVSLLLFRAGCAGSLLYFHGWANALGAWNHFWKSDPWPLVDRLQAAGYPIPVAFATAAAVILLVAPISIILGFLTRLSALLVLAVVIAALPAVLGSGEPLPQELSLFYLLGYFLLLLQGGGGYGLDSAFRKQSAP